MRGSRNRRAGRSDSKPELWGVFSIFARNYCRLNLFLCHVEQAAPSAPVSVRACFQQRPFRATVNVSCSECALGEACQTSVRICGARGQAQCYPTSPTAQAHRIHIAMGVDSGTEMLRNWPELQHGRQGVAIASTAATNTHRPDSADGKLSPVNPVPIRWVALILCTSGKNATDPACGADSVLERPWLTLCKASYLSQADSHECLPTAQLLIRWVMPAPIKPWSMLGKIIQPVRLIPQLGVLGARLTCPRASSTSSGVWSMSYPDGNIHYVPRVL